LTVEEVFIAKEAFAVTPHPEPYALASISNEFTISSSLYIVLTLISPSYPSSFINYY